MHTVQKLNKHPCLIEYLHVRWDMYEYTIPRHSMMSRLSGPQPIYSFRNMLY